MLNESFDDLFLLTKNNFTKKEDKGDEELVSTCDINSITDYYSAYSLGERTRAFLKVQDGCDYNCTFCTIRSLILQI